MITIVTMLHKGHKLQASELKTNMRERAAKSETTESGSEGGEY